MLQFELGEDEESSQCHCCGATSRTGHGFIYRDRVPYAVYYCAWSVSHKERGVSLAVAIGAWEEEATNRDRTCFGLEAYEGQAEVLFRFLDPKDSPWPDTQLLGPMLGREDALAHPLEAEVLAVAETVVREHPAVRRFLRLEHS